CGRRQTPVRVASYTRLPARRPTTAASGRLHQPKLACQPRTCGRSAEVYAKSMARLISSAIAKPEVTDSSRRKSYCRSGMWTWISLDMLHGYPCPTHG